MPGGGALAATSDVNRIEAPVTWKAYLICAFASFGGIFFGYDSGYINGVTGSSVFIQSIEPAGATALSGPHNSLITSILSCGTFFGALIAGDVAEMIGRKWTIIIGCFIYIVGKSSKVETGCKQIRGRFRADPQQVSLSRSARSTVSVSLSLVV
jgi:hypothetical protein